MQAARQALATDVAAGQSDIQAVKRAFRTQARASRGSVAYMQGALGDALRGLNKTGLKGRYKRQAATEIAARQADSIQSLPWLLADARSQRNEDISSARSDLMKTLAGDRLAVAGARGDIRSDVAQKFASLTDKAITDAQSAVKSRRSDKASGGANQDFKDSVKAALSEAKRLLNAYPGQAPSNDREWAAFAGEVQKGDGVTEAGAGVAAVRLLHQQARKKVKKLRKQDSPLRLLFGG